MEKDQESGENCVQIITSIQKQQTISRSFFVQGKGLHCGKKVRVTVHPGEVNQGIVFQVCQNGKRVTIPSCFSHLHSSPRNSTLVKEGVTLSTIEHFLAASWGAGLDNLFVEIEGTEFPAGDGNCAFWSKKFHYVGTKEQDAYRTYYKVHHILWVGEKNRYLFAMPSDIFKVTYFLDHFFGPSFALCMSFAEDQNNFKQIAQARTFAFQQEVQQIIEKGLGRGVRKSALVLDERGRSEKVLTMMGEPAYHKIADLVGDLMLVGHRVVGHFFGLRSGHSMNHQMIKMIAKKARIFDEN